MKQGINEHRDKVLREIKRVVDEKDKFVIFSHEEPDGDAIGSQIALALALRKLGKSVAALRLNEVPRALRFLNREKGIEKYQPERDRSRLQGADVAFILDSCNYFRLGEISGIVEKSPSLKINIDHHMDNAFFGDIDFVRFLAGGTAELIFEVIRELGIRIEGAIAEAIYVGLSTDTVGFKYIDPDGNIIGVVSELIKGGIDIEDLQEKLYYNKPDSYLKDLAGILGRVRYENGGTLAWFTMPRSDCLSYYERELSSIAMQQQLSMRKIRVAVMLHDESAGIEVMLRSKSDCNVGAIAERLGGGGHKTASGILIRGIGLDEAVRKVLDQIKAEMNS